MKHSFRVTIEEHVEFFSVKIRTPLKKQVRLVSPVGDMRNPVTRKASLVRVLGDIGAVIGFQSFPSAMMTEDLNGHSFSDSSRVN